MLPRISLSLLVVNWVIQVFFFLYTHLVMTKTEKLQYNLKKFRILHTLKHIHIYSKHMHQSYAQLLKYC